MRQWLIPPLPPSAGRFPRDLRAPLFREALRPSSAALPPERLGGLVLAVVVRRFLDLTSGDPGDGDGVADHVGGALLSFGAFGHHSSRKPRTTGDAPLSPLFFREPLESAKRGVLLGAVIAEIRHCRSAIHMREPAQAPRVAAHVANPILFLKSHYHWTLPCFTLSI